MSTTKESYEQTATDDVESVVVKVENEEKSEYPTGTAYGNITINNN